MTTIAEVIAEYKARKEATEFGRIKIIEDDGSSSEYPDVTGLHETKDEFGKWIEFDYESFTFGKKLHVKLHGHVVKTITSDVEHTTQPEYIAKNVRIVSIYTHSGKRVEYKNLTNLREDKKSYKVEFDYVVNSKNTHVKMNGEIERYEEVIE